MHYCTFGFSLISSRYDVEENIIDTAITARDDMRAHYNAGIKYRDRGYLIAAPDKAVRVSAGVRLALYDIAPL